MSTIVVGYDGSELAEHALDYAVRLADETTAITVVSGVDADPTPHDLERQRDALAAAAVALDDAGVEHRAVEAIGDIPGNIVRAALDQQADLIVVGSHGKGRLRAALLGSVSLSVATHAHCSVLVVR